MPCVIFFSFFGACFCLACPTAVKMKTNEQMKSLQPLSLITESQNTEAHKVCLLDFSHSYPSISHLKRKGSIKGGLSKRNQKFTRRFTYQTSIPTQLYVRRYQSQTHRHPNTACLFAHDLQESCSYKN